MLVMYVQIDEFLAFTGLVSIWSESCNIQKLLGNRCQPVYTKGGKYKQ